MRSDAEILVLKIGGSVLRDETALPRAAREIYRHVRDGKRVLVVVSALAGTTDQLLAQAKAQCEHPDPLALAALLATGEATAAARLALECDRAGLPATVLENANVGPTTRGDPLAAEPTWIDVAQIRAALDRRPVAILPGFVGRDEVTGRVTLLGRGGSDLTAVFAACELEADRCLLLKDVRGLYECDPSLPGAEPRIYQRISWEDALQLEGAILQPRATLHARDHALTFEVGAPGERFATEVGGDESELLDRAPPPPVLRVLLLGLGTVGRAVLQRLQSEPERYEIVGALVRDPSRDRGIELPPGLLTDDLDEALSRPAEVVIELLGGIEPAGSACRASLAAGRPVITANKALLAAEGRELRELAHASGASLWGSAAVGGALPALETLRLARERGGVRSFEAVLNGTANVVLDRMVAQGEDLDEAVRAAQVRGFAEADSRLDVEGIDTAQKLLLLAQVAFDDEVSYEEISCTGIDELDPEQLRRERERGWVHRLVASCRRTPEGLLAWVAPSRLPATHPLAQTTREENRLLLEPEHGAPVLIAGRGAGAWPTSLAVVADLESLWRAERRSGHPTRGDRDLDALDSRGGVTQSPEEEFVR